MKEWDEVTLYDYLPIKYRYPLNNCITVLGPKNLTDSNCNLLSFYDFKKADMLINNLKNKKNMIRLGDGIVNFQLIQLLKNSTKKLHVLRITIPAI